eukprot:GDKK01054186.1.p1 GENE.GDKK01054186.1~~GDKK01054186.1.p1  ORF type:complete len:880 (+),score=254.12 GDKK01054186.1:122-2641(+)
MNVSSPEDALNLFCLDENKLPDDHDKNEINPESPAVKRSAVNTPSDDENDILPSKRSRLNNESSINRMIDAKDHQISEICSNSENVLFHSDSNHQFSSTSFSSPHSSIFDLPVSKNVIVFDVTNGDVIATKTTSSSNQQPSSHSRKPSSFQNPTAQTNFNSIHDHPSPFAPQLVPSTLSPPSSSKQHSSNHSVTLPNHLHETECMLRVASPSHYEERTAAKQPSTFVHDHAHEFVGVANYLSSTSNDHSAFSFSQELSQRDATRLMQRHETGATACDSSLDHSQHSHHHRDPSSKIQIFDVMPTSCDKNLMLSSSSCEQMDLEGGDERGKERREADEELALEAFLFGDAPSTFPSVSSLIPQPEEEEDSEEEEDEEGGGSESRVSLLFPPQTLHHAVESTVIQLQSNSNISNNNSSSKLTPLQIMSNDPSAVSVSFRASPMPIRSILKRPSLIKKAVCVASPLLSSSPIASKIVPVSLSIDHEEEQFFFQPSGEKQISTDALDGLQPSSTTVYPPSWSKVFLPTVNASSVASDARTKKKERKSQSANESDDEDEELGEVNNNNNCELLVNPFCPSTSPLKKALKEATTPLVVFSPHAANIRDSVNTYYKELPFSRATSNHHAQQLTPLKARKATPRRTRPSEGAVRGRESTPHVGETGGEMASNTLHAGVTPFKAVATPKNLMHTEAVASLDFGDEESDDDANSSSTEFLVLSPQRSNEKEEEDADDKEVRFVVTSAPSRSVRFAPYCSSVGLSSYLPSTSCSLKETKEQKELIRSESANSAVVQDVVSRLNQLDKNTAWEERRRAIRFRNGLYSNSGCFDYESGGMGDEAFNLFQTNM